MLKALNTRGDEREVIEERAPVKEAVQEDEMMMFMIPGATWREIEKLGKKLNRTPEEVVSKALRELKERTK